MERRGIYVWLGFLISPNFLWYQYYPALLAGGHHFRLIAYPRTTSDVRQMGKLQHIKAESWLLL